MGVDGVACLLVLCAGPLVPGAGGARDGDLLCRRCVYLAQMLQITVSYNGAAGGVLDADGQRSAGRWREGRKRGLPPILYLVPFVMLRMCVSDVCWNTFEMPRLHVGLQLELGWQRRE